MGLLAKLFGREDAAARDARRVYSALMAQSRQPAFYGNARFPDNYDGRIEVLTVHIAGVLSALNKHTEQGERLGQAIFDEMKDDFEVALREEGMSDTAVAKRIKPMIALFYTRVKRYAEALHSDGADAALGDAFGESLEETNFVGQMSAYLKAFHGQLDNLTLGQVALAEFTFPSTGDLS